MATGSVQMLRALRRFIPTVQTAVQARSLYQTRAYHFDNTNKTVANRFSHIPGTKDRCYLTYIWIDGTGQGLRAKTKVVKEEPTKISDLTSWFYDGSSTYQARGEDSDMSLVPAAMCKDPFFLGRSKLVLCNTYRPDGSPDETNHRHSCQEAADKCVSAGCEFGIEQEYTLLSIDKRPYGWPVGGYPGPQGPYYCGTGADNAAGRDVSDAHLIACDYAGLSIEGTNAEVMPGQWEYQIGVLGPMEVCDQIWLSRYILHRVAEEFQLLVTLDPKPVDGDWNGAGAHCNFSTKIMTQDGGIKHIWEAIKLLEKRHTQHIAAYDPSGGIDNRRRLTGAHETANIDVFHADEASRKGSIRIPRAVAIKQKGWLEDRRPAANCDPYRVVDMLMRTCVLKE